MYEYYNGEPVSKFNSSKYSFKFVNQQHFFLLQLVLYEAYNNHRHLVPHQNGDEQRIGFSTYIYFLFDQNVAVSRENIYILSRFTCKDQLDDFKKLWMSQQGTTTTHTQNKCSKSTTPVRAQLCALYCHD